MIEEVGVRHSGDANATNKKVNYTTGRLVQRDTRATIDLLDLEEKSTLFMLNHSDAFI